MHKILQDYPYLTTQGFTDSDTFIRESRDQLINDSLEQIYICLMWIKQAKPSKRHHSSYWLKGFVERASGAYISNGSLIVAALLAGFKPDINDFTINAGFKIDPKGNPFHFSDLLIKYQKKYGFNRDTPIEELSLVNSIILSGEKNGYNPHVALYGREDDCIYLSMHPDVNVFYRQELPGEHIVESHNQLTKITRNPDRKTPWREPAFYEEADTIVTHEVILI